MFRPALPLMSYAFHPHCASQQGILLEEVPIPFYGVALERLHKGMPDTFILGAPGNALEYLALQSRHIIHSGTLRMKEHSQNQIELFRSFCGGHRNKKNGGFPQTNLFLYMFSLAS